MGLKALDYESLNENVKKVQYAVRGKLYLRASELLKKDKKGAFVWSSKALVSEIKISHKEVESMLQEQRSTSFQGRLLKHNLDAEVVDALKDLRRQLSENE